MGVSASVGGDSRTDIGWIQSSTIAQAAMIAVAIQQTTAAMSMNDKQVSIQKGYLDLARELREYWKSVYAPCERKTVQEICAEEPYQLQYDRTAGRYVAAVRASFADANDKIRCLGRYCAGATAAIAKDIAIHEAIAVSDATNFAYRVEEDRKEAKDAVLWSRRLEALAMGRDLNKTAIAASAAASDIAGNLSKQAGDGASAAWRAVNYLGNRNPIQPSTRSYSADQYPPAPLPPTQTRHIPIPTPRPEYSGTASQTIIGQSDNVFLNEVQKNWNNVEHFAALNNSSNTAGNGGGGNK